jgi:hypothetical protein
VDPLQLKQLSTVIQFYRKSSDADPGDLMSSDKWAFHTFASLAHRHITSGQKGLEHFLDTLHEEKILGLEESTFTDYLCHINSFFSPVNLQILVEVNKRWVQSMVSTMVHKLNGILAVICGFHSWSNFSRCYKSQIRTSLWLLELSAPLPI